MAFEYDPGKSEENFTKHGINFDDAQELWHDPDCIVIPARTIHERSFRFTACATGASACSQQAFDVSSGIAHIRGNLGDHNMRLTQADASFIYMESAMSLRRTNKEVHCRLTSLSF